MQLPCGSPSEGRLIWTTRSRSLLLANSVWNQIHRFFWMTWRPLLLCVGEGQGPPGGVGLFQGGTLLTAALVSENTREGYWGCFGSRGLLFICKLLRKWCVSVFVRCGTHGLVSLRCPHDLFDSTIKPQRLVPQFAPCLKCVCKSFKFLFLPTTK